MGQGATRTYNLARVVMTVNGLPLEGFGVDDAAVFTPNSDLWEDEVGADGEVSRSANNDRSGEIVFTIMSTSLSNDIFNTFMALTKTVAIGDIFVIAIKDLQSGNSLFAPQCWLKREPDMKFGKKASENEWTVKAAKVTTIRGGALI